MVCNATYFGKCKFIIIEFGFINILASSKSHIYPSVDINTERFNSNVTNIKGGYYSGLDV